MKELRGFLREQLIMTVTFNTVLPREPGPDWGRGTASGGRTPFWRCRFSVAPPA